MPTAARNSSGGRKTNIASTGAGKCFKNAMFSSTKICLSDLSSNGEEGSLAAIPVVEGEEVEQGGNAAVLPHIPKPTGETCFFYECRYFFLLY